MSTQESAMGRIWAEAPTKEQILEWQQKAREKHKDLLEKYDK